MDEYIEREAAIRAVLNDSQEQVGYSREDAADCIRYMDVADVAPVRRWIPVTDSPKGKGWYIVAVHNWFDGEPVTREAYWNSCDWLSCDKKRELTPRVTHWMPLPEPPKEDV